VAAEWIKYIDGKRQKSFLRTLETLSGLQDRERINFIVIGALPLLISGYLEYIVYWDLDLLFKDQASLEEFMGLTKAEGLRIVEYDDQLMISAHITSFHTAWAFDKKWINVDYILKPDIYDFYTHATHSNGPLQQAIVHDGTTYHIYLSMAHPWDVIIDKVLSPRTARDLELCVDTSVDIRHILAVFRKEGANQHFWDHVMTRAPRIGDLDTFKHTLRSILSLAPRLGYTSIAIPNIAATTLGFHAE
jgi:hypothetical protein